MSKKKETGDNSVEDVGDHLVFEVNLDVGVHACIITNADDASI